MRRPSWLHGADGQERGAQDSRSDAAGETFSHNGHRGHEGPRPLSSLSDRIRGIVQPRQNVAQGSAAAQGFSPAIAPAGLTACATGELESVLGGAWNEAASSSTADGVRPRVMDAKPSA